MSNTTIPPPRILLIDDDHQLVALLKDYLCADGFDVDAVHDGPAGVEAALSGQYEIAVLDVMMPTMNGIEVLSLIRDGSDLPVLMLTARGDEADRITGLEQGADDYVPKPCSPRELAARLRAILKRGQLTSEVSSTPGQALQAGPITLWPTQRKATINNESLELTSTEFSLLEVLVQRVGQTVSKAELSELSLNRPLQQYDRSIDVHISSIRRKIGILEDGRSRIQTVFRKGYQLITE